MKDDRAMPGAEFSVTGHDPYDAALAKVVRNLRLGQHQHHMLLCIDPEKPKSVISKPGARPGSF
ncbi:MAG: hypothetical protein AAGM16_06005 [Pseudomonadota bacterium]